MDNQLVIRVKFDHSINPVKDNSYYGDFWRGLSNYLKREYSDQQYEQVFRREFPRNLKQRLIRKYDEELRSFEREFFGLQALDGPYFDKLFFRNKESERIEYVLQEWNNLINTKVGLARENEAYNKLLQKRLLASQIEFGVQNISYSSLQFDLPIEPFNQLTELFDNNFDLLRIFLDQFMPAAFFETFGTYSYDEIPLSTDVHYPQGFREAFAASSVPVPVTPEAPKEKPKLTDRLLKAKWTWYLANGSLLIPFGISIWILLAALDKVEAIQDNQNKSLKPLIEYNNQLHQSYQELIELQQNTLKEQYKRDSLNAGD